VPRFLSSFYDPESSFPPTSGVFSPGVFSPCCRLIQKGDKSLGWTGPPEQLPKSCFQRCLRPTVLQFHAPSFTTPVAMLLEYSRLSAPHTFQNPASFLLIHPRVYCIELSLLACLNRQNQSLGSLFFSLSRSLLLRRAISDPIPFSASLSLSRNYMLPLLTRLFFQFFFFVRSWRAGLHHSNRRRHSPHLRISQ